MGANPKISARRYSVQWAHVTIRRMANALVTNHCVGMGAHAVSMRPLRSVPCACLCCKFTHSARYRAQDQHVTLPEHAPTLARHSSRPRERRSPFRHACQRRRPWCIFACVMVVVRYGYGYRCPMRTTCSGSHPALCATRFTAHAEKNHCRGHSHQGHSGAITSH